jgi:iron complex outermembrane receptor protein
LPPVIGPVPAGGTFSPLAKGRIAGFEVTFNY